MKKNGFTLIEVMSAIAILTMAVGGSYALIQQTLVSASLNQQKLIASYLVQEGIEVVRNVRDSNWLEQRGNAGLSWDDGLTSCQAPNCCEGDYKTDSLPSQTALTSLTNCDYNNLRYLSFGDNGFYGYSGTIQSVFKRKINITKIDNTKLEVLVEVDWSERGRTHTVKAQDNLYDWYGYEEEAPQAPPRICYLNGIPQTSDGAAATALSCTAGEEACRRCDNGSCTYYTSGQHDCSSGYECNGSGLCVEIGQGGAKPNGQSCSLGNECASGFCVDSTCCNTACTGSVCQRCDSNSVSGAGTCGYVNSSAQDPDSECGTTGCYTGNCSGNSYACAYYNFGDRNCSVCQTCVGATNGNCVNYAAYDEDSGCTSACYGCSGGVCAPIPVGSQDTWGPNACIATHYRCNGAGVCNAPWGSAVCVPVGPSYVQCSLACPGLGYAGCGYMSLAYNCSDVYGACEVSRANGYCLCYRWMY